jgi:hypothetical protein
LLPVDVDIGRRGGWLGCRDDDDSLLPISTSVGVFVGN